MRRALGGAVVLAGALAATAQSQVPELPTITRSWNEVSYPKLLWSPRDGMTVGLYYGQTEPMGYADFDRPERYHGSVSIDGQLSQSGRKDVTVAGRFPRLVPGWRFSLVFNAYAHPRDPYFGVGNDATYSAANVIPGQERFYEAERHAVALRGDVQRAVAGNLRLLAGFSLQRRKLELPEGPSVLATDEGAGVVTAVGTGADDSYARFGVIFDSRDDEVAPRSGIKLEAIHGLAAYTRTTASAAGYVPLGAGTVVAARVVGQRMTGDPPLTSWYLIESSDDPYEGVGGEISHRALFDLRYLGRHKLFGSVDVRHDLLRVETLVQVTLVGFVDAGRVFEGEDFRLTTEGMHVGGGAGLFLRWGRNGVIGFTGGAGGDGAVFHVSTRWAY